MDYKNVNRNWTGFTADDDGENFITLRRSADATHAVVMVRESLSTPWTDKVKIKPIGVYETNDQGRGVLPSVYELAAGDAPIAQLPYPGSLVPGQDRAIDMGVTGEDDYVVLALPFGPFDAIYLFLEPDATKDEQECDYAVTYMRETRSIADSEYLTFAKSTVDALTSASSTNGLILGIDEPTVDAQAGAVIRFHGSVTDELGQAIEDDTVKLILTLVENGADLVPATAFAPASGDGGNTTVTAVGATGLGAYVVNPHTDGTFDVDVTDVVGTSGTTVNGVLSVVGVGATGMNIDGERSEQSIVLGFAGA